MSKIIPFKAGINKQIKKMADTILGQCNQEDLDTAEIFEKTLLAIGAIFSISHSLLKTIECEKAFEITKNALLTVLEIRLNSLKAQNFLNKEQKNSTSAPENPQRPYSKRGQE